MKNFVVRYMGDPTPVVFTGRWKTVKIDTYDGLIEQVYFELVEKRETGWLFFKRTYYFWAHHNDLRVSEETINECTSL